MTSLTTLRHYSYMRFSIQGNRDQAAPEGVNFYISNDKRFTP